MEYPSKRLKLSRVAARLTSKSARSRTNEGLSGSAVDTRDEDKDGMSRQPIKKLSDVSELRKRDSSSKSAKEISEDSAPQRTRPRLFRRHAEPHFVPRAPDPHVYATVVDVIIDDGANAVAAITLPTVPTVVPFPNFDMLTVPAVPAVPTPPSVTLPTVPAYPFPSAGNSATAVTGSPSSQVVLSSPPSTPVLSSASVSSSEASTQPSTTHSSTPSSTAALATLSALQSNRTLSTTTFTSTGVSTTVTGTPVINLATVNGTLGSISGVTSATLATSVLSSSGLSGSGTNPATASETASGGSSAQTSGAGVGGVGLGQAGTTTSGGAGGAPTSTGSSTSSNDNGPATPTVVGGVIGGVAGFAILLLFILFLLRQWKRRSQSKEQAAIGGAPPSTGLSGTTATRSTDPMSERSSHTPLTAAVSPAFLSRWRHSSQTASTAETLPSEKGFQKLGGRKIPSVLSSGGDGYGGNYGAFGKETGAAAKETAPTSVAGSSFYRDSAGFYGGPGQAPPSPRQGIAPGPGPSSRGLGADAGAAAIDDDAKSEITFMRPSPARTPITNSPGIPTPQRFPTPPRSVPQQQPPRATEPTSAPGGPLAAYPPGGAAPAAAAPTPDGVGRSLASFDGSRGSRFTESV